MKTYFKRLRRLAGAAALCAALSSATLQAVPVVNILGPFDGSSYLPGTSLPVLVEAYDSEGLITEVEFLLNDVLVGNVTSAPFVFNVLLPSTGTYRLAVRATSSAGGQVVSDEINLHAEYDLTAPKVYIDHPLPLGGGDTVNDVSVASSVYLNAVVIDDGGAIPMENVTFYINGAPLGNSESMLGNVYSLFFSPYGVGSYSIVAVVEDTDGNLGYSVPLPLDVGLLERPLPTGTVSKIDSPVARGEAIDLFVKTQGFLIPIDRVDFYANGIFVGNSDTPVSTDETTGEDTFTFRWTPPQSGDYVIQSRLVQIDPAEATYDNWFVTDGVPVTVEGFGDIILDGSFNDENYSGLVGEPITFTFAPDGIDDIQLVQLLLGEEIVGSSLTVPAEFTYTPQDAGEYVFMLQVTLTDATVIDGEPISIMVDYPDPLSENEDFVYQVFLDLLKRVPTPAEQAGYVSRIDGGELTRSRFIREIINPADGQAESEYDAVRNTLLAYRMAYGLWPDHEMLEADTLAVRDGGLVSHVTTVMPVLESRYGTSVPDKYSSDADINTFISYIFAWKYGVAPTSEQLNLARTLFKLSDRDVFVADFLEDNEVVATSTAYYTTGIGFKFALASPPSDAYLREADVASIYINFLKDVPDDSVISEKADMLFAAFIDEILASSTYSARFTGTFTQLENAGNGWKRSEWFGYFNTSFEPWMYHSTLGWISFSLTGQDESNLWYYDYSMGWNWTQAGTYPNVFNAGTGHWLYSAGGSYQPGQMRWFFDYNAKDWIQR